MLLCVRREAPFLSLGWNPAVCVCVWCWSCACLCEHCGELGPPEAGTVPRGDVGVAVQLSSLGIMV
jgi:hypothetical protein